MIDALDLEILKNVQENAKITNADLARRVGLAPSAVLERVRKLEERGFIRGYSTRLDPKKLGLGLLAFVMVKTNDRGDMATAKRLAAMPEVQEIHHIAGEDCYIVKVRVADTDALGTLLRGEVLSFPGVTGTRTTIVLDTIKDTTNIPLPALESVEA
jgi:Lrp/AsnC family leucine-responsive transcriptional regulator